MSTNITDQSQAGLEDFESNTKTQPESMSPEPKPIDPDNIEKDDLDLPNDKNWDDEIRTSYNDLVAFVRFDGEESYEVETSPTDETISSGTAGIPVKGTEALKEASDTVERIIPPKTYSDFPDFEPFYASVTTTHRSSRYGGWGITPSRLEAAMRFVSGGGRYRASNFTITALDRRKNWLIEYKGNTYIFSYVKVGQPEEVLSTHDIKGITIENEDNPKVLEGIQKAIEILPNLGIEITGFEKRTSDMLYFSTNKDKPIAFSGSSLSHLTSLGEDLSELTGTHTIKPYHLDETYEYTWGPDDTEHKPGDTIEQPNSKRLILGYTKFKDTIKHGLRPNKYTVGMRIKAKQWHLEIYPDKYDNRIDTRISGNGLNPRTELIAEIPYDKPDHPNHVLSIDPLLLHLLSTKSNQNLTKTSTGSQ